MPKVRRIAKPRNYSPHGHNRTCEEAPECQTPKSHSDVDQVDGICDGKAKQTEFPYLPQSWNNPPLKEAGSSPRLNIDASTSQGLLFLGRSGKGYWKIAMVVIEPIVPGHLAWSKVHNMPLNHCEANQGD